LHVLLDAISFLIFDLIWEFVLEPLCNRYGERRVAAVLLVLLLIAVGLGLYFVVRR
jgi:hypothetical protein